MSLKKRRKIIRKALHATQGQAPGTMSYVGTRQNSELRIEVFDYNQSQLREEHLENIEQIFGYEDPKTVTWVNFNGLSNINELKKIGDYFGLHPLIQEDLVNTTQRPKLIEYQDYIFVVCKMIRKDKNEESIREHLSLVLGKDYLLSFQESEGDVFDSVRHRIRESKGIIRTQGSDYLLFALLDAIVDSYLLVVEELGEQIEELEDKVMEQDNSEIVMGYLQGVKKELLNTRRVIWPLRDVSYRMDKINSELVGDIASNYFRDLHDSIFQVSETLDFYREMHTSLVELYLTLQNNRMNETMKYLTMIATIFIPLSFITGLYGMNFEFMPELKWHYGYFMVLGLILTVFVISYLYFKRKKWL